MVIEMDDDDIKYHIDDRVEIGLNKKRTNLWLGLKRQEYGSTSLTKEQARKLMNHLSELIAKMNDKRLTWINKK